MVGLDKLNRKDLTFFLLFYLPCVTISFALNDNSESLSATHGYNVTPRDCLENEIKL